ncbi:hypothetical protein ACIBH1_46940 [Nonomuraea sp. NPDC050663]|uniref:hypothetical protein n=1 Tax=Nonomuraea sp. NPDC050663 TaxID=3364370 RepID=UPI00379E5702
MKLRVYFDPRVREVLRAAAPALRLTIADALLDLGDDPIPVGAQPYAEVEGAYELATPVFRAIYTYDGDLPYVSVWVLHINT